MRSNMAGPRTIRNPGNGGVQVREGASAGAPVHVSGESKTRNPPPNPKSARNFQRSPQPHATLPDRPSTSGGVSIRKPIERRGTEDDLHVHPLRANQFGTTYYNFPLPGSLSTPAGTPRSASSRTYTPEIPEPETVGSIHSHLDIGMALGSPSHQTTIWSPHVQFQASSREYSPESLEDWQNQTNYPKRKPSKWKKLGGLFGRKASDSSVEYSHGQPEVQTMNAADYTTFPEPPAEKPRGRARTNSERKILKQKPDMQRSNTVPIDFQIQESKELPKPPPKQFPILAKVQPPQIKLDGGPLLDVDIPSIEMERYSVMFGNLIKPASSASALLARRQATLDKLKMVNEAIAEHERKEAESKSKLLRPRRATSPQPTKSPVISLFPMVPRTQRDGSSHTPYRSSPLHRSNTSPAALSPNRQTFEPLRPNEEEHTIMLAPTPTLQPSAVLTSPWSADESFALESPSSVISVEEVHDSAPLRPRLTEPKWDMISPRTVVPEDPMKVKPLKLANKADSQNHHVARKQLVQPSSDAQVRVGITDEAEERIKTAADLSIARQISLSRRQRQLLIPAKSRIANAGPTVVNKEGTRGLERLQVNEKKPMTARLVNVQARRAVKSERVLFDEA